MNHHDTLSQICSQEDVFAAGFAIMQYDISPGLQMFRFNDELFRVPRALVKMRHFKGWGQVAPIAEVREHAQFKSIQPMPVLPRFAEIPASAAHISAELSLHREFFEAWEALHALANDKLHRTKKEEAAQRLVEIGMQIKRMRDPTIVPKILANA